jgi:hypothetical protein
MSGGGTVSSKKDSKSAVRSCIPTSGEVSAGLDAAGISHGVIYRESQPHNNFGFSDGVSVFVKVERISSDGLSQQKELAVANYVGNTISTPRPIAHEPFIVGGGFATAWEWVPHDVIPYSRWRSSDSLVLWGLLDTLHRIPIPDVSLGLTRAGGVLDLVQKRAEAFGDAHDTLVVDHLIEMATFVSKRWDVAVQEADHAGELVLSHGDMHPGNVMITEEGMWLCDWESSVLAPQEWDLVALKHTLVRIEGNANAWSPMEPVAQRMRSDRLLLAEQVKAVMNTSYVMMFPYREHTFRRRVRLLVDLLPHMNVGDSPETVLSLDRVCFWCLAVADWAGSCFCPA